MDQIPYLNFSGRKVYFLHESLSFLENFLKPETFNKNSFVISTVSWFTDDAKILLFLGYLKSLVEKYPYQKDYLLNNVIFCANSEDEYVSMHYILSDFKVIKFTPASLINENVFTVGVGERVYDAVVNSKPYLFKRLYLIEENINWLFITYGLDPKIRPDDFYDIRSRVKGKIVHDIPDWKVSNHLSEAKVGVILSVVEGLCSASLEYLLSGLPVVSTFSLGGRDEFYNMNNAKIVKPSTDDINRAVAEIIDQNITHDQRLEIRRTAIQQITLFRMRLAEVLAGSLELPIESVYSTLCDYISRDSKLMHHRVAWGSVLNPNN